MNQQDKNKDQKQDTEINKSQENQKVNQVLENEDIKIQSDDSLDSQEQSLLSKIMNNKKKQMSRKQKNNPLMIDEDIEQQQNIQMKDQQNLQVKVEKQSKQSVLSLTANLKQSDLDIITQEQKQVSKIIDEVKPQIFIQIIESYVKVNTLSKQVIYTIQGQDIHGGFTIQRKLSQFIQLRRILRDRWPGCYIPGIKHKIDLKNQNQADHLMKSVLLNFLISISYSQYIYYKQEMQLFLRSQGIDIVQMFQQMPQLRINDLISRFQYAFGSQLQLQKVSYFTEKIANYQKTFKKIIFHLEQMSNNTLKLVQSYQNYYKNAQRFSQIIKLYEHISLAQFTQNKRQMSVLVKDQDKYLQKIYQLTHQNPYFNLYQFLIIEKIDSKSFLDSILTIQLYYIRKQQLQKEILQKRNEKGEMSQQGESKKLLKTLPILSNGKYKSQKLQKTQQRLRKLLLEKQQNNRLIDLIEYNLVKQIYNTFQTRRIDNYNKTVLKYVNSIQNTIVQEQHAWKSVANQALNMMQSIKQIS